MPAALATPTPAPAVTSGQAQANQIAGSGGSNSAYMAARGAAPTTPNPGGGASPAPPPTASQTDSSGRPLAISDPKGFMNWKPPAPMSGDAAAPPVSSKPETPTPGTNFMQIPNSQLQPMQQNSAQQIAQQQYLTQENLAKQMQTNDQTSLSSSPWTDNHAQMFTQLMSQPGLPDNIRQSLMDAQNHFTSASTTPAAGRPAAASPVRANSDHFNAPGKGHVPPHGLDNNPKQTATAPEPKPPEAGNEQPFKGRTTSMQRRGRGVGQPTVPNPEPLTPALAAKAQLSAGKQPAPRVA